MNKVSVDYGIVSMGIYREISYLQKTKDCIKDVCIQYNNPDYFGYLCDMLNDGYDITCCILKFRSANIPDNLILKINKWYAACESLLYDIRGWLYNDCEINAYEFLRKGGVFNGD